MPDIRYSTVRLDSMVPHQEGKRSPDGSMNRDTFTDESGYDLVRSSDDMTTLVIRRRGESVGEPLDIPWARVRFAHRMPPAPKSAQGAVEGVSLSPGMGVVSEAQLSGQQMPKGKRR